MASTSTEAPGPRPRLPAPAGILLAPSRQTVTSPWAPMQTCVEHNRPGQHRHAQGLAAAWARCSPHGALSGRAGSAAPLAAALWAAARAPRARCSLHGKEAVRTAACAQDRCRACRTSPARGRGACGACRRPVRGASRASRRPQAPPAALTTNYQLMRVVNSPPDMLSPTRLPSCAPSFCFGKPVTGWLPRIITICPTTANAPQAGGRPGMLGREARRSSGARGARRDGCARRASVPASRRRCRAVLEPARPPARRKALSSVLSLAAEIGRPTQ